MKANIRDISTNARDGRIFKMLQFGLTIAFTDDVFILPRTKESRYSSSPEKKLFLLIKKKKKIQSFIEFPIFLEIAPYSKLKLQQ